MHVTRALRRVGFVIGLGMGSCGWSAGLTWDVGGGVDTKWSTISNWNPDGLPAGNDLVFGAAGLQPAGTTTNTVDASVSVNSLTFANTGANYHTTQIPTGVTLTISGAAGGNAVLIGGQAGNTNVAIAGAGTLSIASASANFLADTNGNTYLTTLDMSGLANLSANVANFLVPNITTPYAKATVLLGTTNVITAATTISVAGGVGDTQDTGILSLGGSNAFNTALLAVGRGKGTGTLNFRSGLTGPTVTIRGATGGSTRANLKIGAMETAANGAGAVGTVDLTGGTVDALLGTVLIGSGSTPSGANTGTGTFTFNAGTIDATSIEVGQGSRGNGYGTLNVQGTGTLIAGTLTLGNQTDTATGSTATVNLTSGTLAATSITAGAGTATRTFNWNSGTVQNKSGGGLTIATGVPLTLLTGATHTFFADPARTVTVNSAIAGGAGTGGITKTGSGTLVLAGTNSYTGGTTLSAGTLFLSGAGALPSTGALRVGAGTILSLADGTARTTTAGSLSLATGSSLVLDWNGATLDNLTSTAAATTTGNIAIAINNSSPSGAGGALISSASGGLTTAGGTKYFLANNTTFTAPLTVTDTAVSIGAQTSASALTTAYWKGNQLLGTNAAGADNAMALSTGTVSNWTTDAGGATPTGLVPGSGANAVFSATGATQQSSIVLGADMTLNSLTLSDPTPVTVAAGNVLTLMSAGTGTASAISANENGTVNAPVVLGAGQTWTVAGSKTLTVGGVISGTNGLTKAGTGTLTLGASNSYSGTTTLSDGTLRLADGSLASSALSVTSASTTLVVAADATVPSVDYSYNSASAHTTQIAAGKTLTIAGGALRVGLGGTGNATTIVNIQGSTPGVGTLTFNSPTQDFLVGRAHTIWSGTQNSTLDMSGLGTVNIAADEIRVCYETLAPFYNGTLILGSSNNITVNSVLVGNWPGAGTIKLGTSNTINADTISMAYGVENSTGGTIQFNSGLTNPTVTIRNKAGTGRANLYGGYGTNGPAAATVDLTGGTADVLLGTVILGRPRIIPTSDSTGTITFNAGTVDATTVTLGQTSNDGSGTSAGIGTINVNGGTLIVDDLKLGDQVHAQGQARGYLNIGGGTVQATTIWKGPGTGTGTPIRQLNFTSGTLTHKTGTDLTVSSDISFRLVGDAAKTVFADTGRSVTLHSVISQASGTGGIVKTGAGLLTLNATNSYTGGTTVNAGTLVLGNTSGTLADTGAVTVSGGTLDLGANSDTVGAVTLASGTITGTSGILSGSSYNVQAGAVNAVLGGAGALTKTGAGSVTLSRQNTFSGGTTVSGGTLVLGDATNTLADGGTVNVNGGTLDLGANSDTVGAVTLAAGSIIGAGTLTGTSYAVQAGTASANLAGAGALTKTAAGTVTLSGTNSYGGGTTITGGTLVLAGANALPGTSAISVSGAGSTLSLADGTARTTTAPVLTLASGSTLKFDWIGSALDTLTSTAAATTAGNVMIALNTSNPTSGGTLLNSPSGGLKTADSTRYLLANNSDYTATLTATDTAVSIGSYTGSAPLTTAYWMGNKVFGTGTAGIDNAMAFSSGIASNWSTAAGSYAATPLVPGTTANVVFSANGASQQSSIVLGTDMTLNSLTFNDPTPVTIAAGNMLTLASTGTGAASAISANQNATINVDQALSTAQTWTAAAGMTLTVGGGVSGTGSVTTAGAGGVTLSGANTYTGGTIVSAGTLTLGNATNSLADSGAVNVNGGILALGANSDTVGAVTLTAGSITSSTGILTGSVYDLRSGTVTAKLGGTGIALTKTTAGTVTLSGASTYTGATTVSAGILSLANNLATGTVAGGVVVNSGGSLELQNAITVGAEALSLTGTGSAGSGALRNLSGNNTWGGTVTLAGPATLQSDNGTLTLNAATAVAGTGQALTVQGAGNTTISGAIATGTGSLTKAGSGLLTLSGTNSYSGGTNVSGGTLLLSGATALPAAGTLMVGGAGSTLSLADGTIRTTTAGGLTLTAGAVLKPDWNTTTADLLTTSATATVAGNPTVYLSPTGTFTSGTTYTLLTAAGGLTSSGYALANNTNYTGVINSATGTAVTVTPTTATALTQAYWRGNQVSIAPGAMAASTGTLSNWTTDAAGATPTGLVPGSGANVSFSATGATQQSSIVLGADMTLNSLTFGDTTPVTVGGANKLTLMSAGTGAASAINANENATLTTAVATGAAQTWTVAASKTLTANGVISGTNGLTKAGTGTLILGATNTLTGATTLSDGTLRLGGSLATSALSVTGPGTALMVDADATVQSLSYSNVDGTAHTTTIAAGKTLTVAGDLLAGPTTGVSPNVYTSSVTITGAGALAMNSPTANLALGGRGVIWTHSRATLDLSGLASFTANINELRMGIGTAYTDGNILILAQNNVITANKIRMGYYGSIDQFIRLGQNNQINVDALYLSGPDQYQEAKGTITFNTGLTNPTLTLRGKAGGNSRVGAVSLGNRTSSGNNKAYGTLDLSGGSVDAMLGAVDIGTGGGPTNGEEGYGYLTLAAGTIDATTMVAGKTTTTGVWANGWGYVTLNGGTLTVGTLTVADQFAASGAGWPRATGTINLSGGTLKATTIAGGTNEGRAFLNFSNGTLQNKAGTDLTVSAGVPVSLLTTATHTLTADPGRAVTINAPITYNSGGTGGITVNGGGTVVMNASSFYPGNTVVSGATLIANGASVAASTPTGTITVNSPVITGMSSTAGLAAGQPVSGTNIPANAYIRRVDSASQITISADATATGARTLTCAAGAALGTGSVSVGAGGILGGTGVIDPAGSGTVTVSGTVGSPAALAPGASIGALTIGSAGSPNNVIMGDNSTMPLESNWNVADSLTIYGNLDLNSLSNTLQVTGYGAPWSGTIIQTIGGTISGSFDNVTWGGLLTGVTVHYTSNTIIIDTVPEPATLLLLLLGGALASRRRPGRPV